MSAIRTHYDNLQVARNASPEVVRAAFKGLTQRYHPDRNPNDRARCERIMKIVNRAFEVLSDPQKRAEHDAWIATEETVAQAQAAEAAAQAATFGKGQGTHGYSVHTNNTVNQSASSNTWREPQGSAPAQASREPENASATDRPRDASREAKPVPPNTASSLRGQKGLLRVLIFLLKFSGIVTGLILYGWLGSVETHVPREYVRDWSTVKMQVWVVWGITVAAYFGAGLLLETRSVRSTCWMAIGFIWAGAILAPLTGLVLASTALSAPMVSYMTGYHVPDAIRGSVFALVCTLYLTFSRRVRSTYLAPDVQYSATSKRSPQSVHTSAHASGNVDSVSIERAKGSVTDYWGGGAVGAGIVAYNLVQNAKTWGQWEQWAYAGALVIGVLVALGVLVEVITWLRRANTRS